MSYEKADLGFLLDQIMIEERCAAEAAIHRRMAEIAEMPNCRLRADLFSAALLAGAVQVAVELQGKAAATDALAKMSIRLAAANPHQRH
jgi:hypothetical protein